MKFVGFNIQDSILFKTINIPQFFNNTSLSHTLSLGLYSLNGSTLSLGNSASGSITASGLKRCYLSITGTSATQNITPGTWYFGLLISISSGTVISIYGQSSANPSNAFPGVFIGGIMTDSTNALPTSFATSNLDITGVDALSVPSIIDRKS